MSSPPLSEPDVYLHSAEFERLWPAAHEAWCRNGELRGNAMLRGLSASEAHALSGLLGRRRPWRAGDTAAVPIAQLDRRLREAQLAAGLERLLERLVGPLASRPEQRQAEQQAEEEGWLRAHAHRALERHPGLSAWLEQVRSNGSLTRRANQAGRERFELLEELLDVVGELPLEPPQGLPTAAAALLGHTHALDRGTPIDGLLGSALAQLEEVPRPTDSDGRRALYERYGIFCDALSSTVLCAGMSPAGDTLAARKLRLSSDAGAACSLTLAELLQEPVGGVAGDVYVCENPEVMASALSALGRRCPPLVCVSGWPSAAALRLLRACTQAGATIHYHGDFDWDGLRIAGRVMDTCAALPWRFGRDSYLEAPAGPELDQRRGLLPERFKSLADAMAERGCKVAEEQLLNELICDLVASADGG